MGWYIAAGLWVIGLAFAIHGILTAPLIKDEQTR